MCGLQCWREGCGEMENLEFNYNTRNNITNRREEELKKRTARLTGEDKCIAKDLADSGRHSFNPQSKEVLAILESFYRDPGKKPSSWFGRKSFIPGMRAHGALLDAYVPRDMQPSFLYIVDKLNRFPYSKGWNRRTVRTAGYGPQMNTAFWLLSVYERLFYCGTKLEDVILRRLEPEVLDYIKGSLVNFMSGFSYLYAAEIDRGNRAVIGALNDLIYSENNTAYLDREMVLGILRSDNRDLHRALGELLLAARLQEGVRQAICEAMDEGTEEAFLSLLSVIQKNDLIRFSSVKRSVSTWIGIFNENSVDRVSGKLLELMGSCLASDEYCIQQLETNDSIAISAALWAQGFREIGTALASMERLIESGSKNQKLTASYYNQMLGNARYSCKVAKRVILRFDGDLELAACFMTALTSHYSSEAYRLFSRKEGQAYYHNEIQAPSKPRVTDYFESREEAEALYSCLGRILELLPKKGVTYDPCIFPWYSVFMGPSEVISLMAVIAYVLQDREKITDMAGRLGEVMSSGYTLGRSRLVNLLLYAPENQRQRELLIGYMGNAEEMTSAMAYNIVKHLELEARDYMQLEDMLRFKRAALRAQLIDILMKRDDGGLKETLQRLLQDKREEKRTAALDMMLQIRKDPKREALAQAVSGLEVSIAEPTEKEQILIGELQGKKDGVQEISAETGYGIYDPGKEYEAPEVEPDRGVISGCLAVSEREAVELIKKLDDLIDRNRDYEYEASNGERILLGSCYTLMAGAASGGYRLENYPLPEVFREFYEKEIKNYGVFIVMEALLMLEEQAYQAGARYYRAIFGKMPFKPLPFSLKYPNQVRQLRLIYRMEYLDKKLLFKEGLEVIRALTGETAVSGKRVCYRYRGWGNREYNTSTGVNSLPLLGRYFEGLGYWETDEEFREAFGTALRFERLSMDAESDNFLWERREPMTPIRFFWFVKAYRMGIISMDMVCLAVMRDLNREECLRVLCQFVKGDSIKTGYYPEIREVLGEAFYEVMREKGCAYMRDETPEGAACREVYNRIVPVMVDTELRRGDSETVFSKSIGGIKAIFGTAYLVRILKALGKDTLDRQAYYGWYGGNRLCTKRENLSSLLKYCYPAEGETEADLAAGLKGAKIRESRLVEVAMYAPQWIDLIEAYLGWEGLKSGCYYFMAHMDERFDDRKTAMIARYTPLTPEELQSGAFDVNWFKEACGRLGEERFNLLYNAAKYISDGQKHSRARKYADAALGRTSLDDLKREISAKRNKDLLMSVGLVPFGEKKEADVMDRYQFIQQFAKESKQFGAQRRASEGQAVQTALKNLSVNAGYADVTRLTLNVESRMASLYAPYLEWKPVDDVEVKIEIDGDGKSAVLCRKGEKALKSVPSRLGKAPYVLEIKEVNKKLRDQHARTRSMMEEAMESRTEFSAEEVSLLLENPVVWAILEPLVFVSGENRGFLAPAADGGLGLLSWDGRTAPVIAGETLRIAHPFDLFKAGDWHEYQRCLFERKEKQPFKQVFRELYVKLPEEENQRYSRLFAGYQIQPKKTVGCLRGRRWVADYEEGLQKVFYKENIVARIYALADWFSPGDAEEPTLEWVEFSDRKTFLPLTIGQVPDLIYSEVMRDVDLAVSVAHAGGVDPETSHSTIEMRRAIVEFNLPLFGLKNVTLTDSHARIKGARGEYTVQLGSGVVHQVGGAMINILPVHSQSRGKLFLPFVDEDPKTAEIMSKIVLLAEDKKIKDPFILDQIR